MGLEFEFRMKADMQMWLPTGPADTHLIHERMSINQSQLSFGKKLVCDEPRHVCHCDNLIFFYSPSLDIMHVYLSPTLPTAFLLRLFSLFPIASLSLLFFTFMAFILHQFLQKNI